MLQQQRAESESWLAGDPEGSIFLPDDPKYADGLAHAKMEIIFRRGAASGMSDAEVERTYNLLRLEQAILLEAGRVATSSLVVVK